MQVEHVILKTSAGIAYEIQVGGYAVHELQALMGAREAVELHTHHYLEGNVATGQLLPRLVGFLSAEERAFFLSFIKVPGISPQKRGAGDEPPSPSDRRSHRGGEHRHAHQTARHRQEKGRTR